MKTTKSKFSIGLFTFFVIIIQSCTPDCEEQMWFQDADGDGFGNPLVMQSSCDQPTGYILDNTDFDDANASAFPNATELCNGIDDNGDGTIDENPTGCAVNEVCENGACVTAVTYYLDADTDGFGDLSNTIVAGTIVPSGYVANNTDCNDADASINPGATEICGNNIDDNCDGNVDENCITVGAQYQGGTIIYVTPNGQNGLIALNADLAVGDWMAAANNSANYSFGGYSDWYLPNRFQLQLMYDERAFLSGLANGDYWSSTFYNPNFISNPPDAYFTDFTHGNEAFDDRNLIKNIRPVRNF